MDRDDMTNPLNWPRLEALQTISDVALDCPGIERWVLWLWPKIVRYEGDYGWGAMGEGGVGVMCGGRC